MIHYNDQYAITANLIEFLGIYQELCEALTRDVESDDSGWTNSHDLFYNKMRSLGMGKYLSSSLLDNINFEELAEQDAACYWDRRDVDYYVLVYKGDG